MLTLVALVFHYSLNGLLAEEGTDYYDYCFRLLDQHGGPDADDDSMAFLEGASLHLMGRSAYDGMAESMPSSPGHPWAGILNAAPKAVVSRTMTEADWAGTRILSGDLATEIASLTHEGDGYAIVWGGVQLWQSLIALDLLDEFRIGMHPYVSDEGARLFTDVPHGYALELVKSRTAANGVIGLHYRRSR